MMAVIILMLKIFLFQNWRQGQPNPHDNETTCLFTEANGIPNDHDGDSSDGDDDDGGGDHDDHKN